MHANHVADVADERNVVAVNADAPSPAPHVDGLHEQWYALPPPGQQLQPDLNIHPPPSRASSTECSAINHLLVISRHHAPQSNARASDAASHDDELRNASRQRLGNAADASVHAAADAAGASVVTQPAEPWQCLCVAVDAARGAHWRHGGGETRKKVHALHVPQLPEGRRRELGQRRETTAHLPSRGLRKGLRENVTSEGALEVAHWRATVRVQLDLLRQEIHQERRAAEAPQDPHRREEVRLHHLHQEIHEERSSDQTR